MIAIFAPIRPSLCSTGGQLSAVRRWRPDRAVLRVKRCGSGKRHPAAREMSREAQCLAKTKMTGKSHFDRVARAPTVMAEPLSREQGPAMTDTQAIGQNENFWRTTTGAGQK